jgi:hypothetical protein
MRLVFFAALVLVACGGKFADDDDAGPGDASIKDVVVKKDGPPIIDTSIDLTPPPPPPPPGGLNVSGNGPGNDSEDEIAVAPDGTIAILWSSFIPTSPFVTMRYAFSTNDGKSFSAPVDVITPSGLLPGDPAITVDAQGNFWAAYLGIAFNGQNVDYSRVFVAEAPKGTMKFGMPVEVSPPSQTTSLIDHPKIHVTSAGTLLVGWADIPNGGQTATGVVARSTNGTTWTRTTIVQEPESPFANFFWFCDSAAGVHTVFLEATNINFFAALRTSTDDGLSFGSGNSIQVSLDADQVAGLDPMCAANGNEVWVMYMTTQSPSIDETTLDGADHIWVAHSTNGGQTFPSRTESLDTKASKLATIPLLVRDNAGVLDVAYVAGNADQDTNGSIRFTRGGGPSTFVDGPMLFDLSRTSQTWVGDYFGGVPHAGSLYLAYPRNETGLDHIYFAKVAVP